MKTEKEIRKLVISKLRHFWLYVVFSFVFALIIQIVGVISPLLMKKIVDDYIPNKDIKILLLSIIIFTTIPIISATLTAFYNFILNVVGKKAGQKLTLKGFEKLLYQPIKYFDVQNSSELASYCKSESMNYVVYWLFDIPQLFAQIIGGIVIFLFVLSINVYIALSFLFFIPITYFPSNHFAKKIKKYVETIVENNAKANQILNDSFRGIKTIKSMVLEKIQLIKYHEINNNTVRIWSKTAAYDNLNSTWTNSFVDQLYTGIIFSICAIMIINDNLSLGSLLLIMNYMPRIFSAIKAIANTNFDFKKQLAQYDKLFNIIVMDDERNTLNGDKNFNFNDKITFNQVVFSYNKERGNVLNGLSLSIDIGKWIGIIGSSGAGKTTIFDLLLRLYEFEQGDILIDGICIKEIKVDELRTNITKVSQDIFLFPGTFYDNMRIIKPNATDHEIEEAFKKVELDDFIKKLPNGMLTEIGENGLQLSGGEKQRLCLAQGLLRESKILLLDEVTANIDVITERAIKTTINRIINEKNITVIAISHRIDFLDNTDNIYIIENGNVIDFGDYDTLKTRCAFFNNES